MKWCLKLRKGLHLRKRYLPSHGSRNLCTSLSFNKNTREFPASLFQQYVCPTSGTTTLPALYVPQRRFTQKQIDKRLCRCGRMPSRTLEGLFDADSGKCEYSDFNLNVQRNSGKHIFYCTCNRLSPFPAIGCPLPAWSSQQQARSKMFCLQEIWALADKPYY